MVKKILFLLMILSISTIQAENKIQIQEIQKQAQQDYYNKVMTKNQYNAFVKMLNIDYCKRFNTHISPLLKKQLEDFYSLQFNTAHSDISDFIQYKNWWIVNADPEQNDGGFHIYFGNPLIGGKLLDDLSGNYAYFEFFDAQEQLKKLHPKMPSKLINCVAQKVVGV